MRTNDLARGSGIRRLSRGRDTEIGRSWWSAWVCSALAALCPHPAAAQTWVESGDAPQSCASAQVTVGTGALTQITGTISGIQDVDIYRVRVNSTAGVSASRTGSSTMPIAVLYWFSAANCNGLAMSNFADIGQTATITGQLLPGAGEYNLVIGSWEKSPLGAGSQAIWSPGTYPSQTAPNGPGASGPLVSWSTTSWNQPTGAYTITLTGVNYSTLPVANDACANATTIATGNATPYTNVGATTDGPTACGSLGRDVWFRHTAVGCGTFAADTCASPGHDSVVAVYTGSCGALTLVACNDDSTTCGATSLSSRVSWTGAIGTEYLIRVGGFQGVQGSGALTLTAPTGGAPQITLQPARMTYTKVGANVTLTAAVNGPGPIQVRWRRFGDENPIAGATTTTLSLSPVSGADMNSYWLEAENCWGIARSHTAAVRVSPDGVLPPSVLGCQPSNAYLKDEDGDGIVELPGDANGDGLHDYFNTHTLVNGDALMALRGNQQEEIIDLLIAKGYEDNIGHVFCALSILLLRGIDQADMIAIRDNPSFEGKIAGFFPNTTYSRMSNTSVPSLGVTSGFYSPNTIEERDPWVNGAGVNVAIVDTGVDNPGSRLDVNTASNPFLLNDSLPIAVYGYDVTRDMSLPPLLVPPFNALRVEALYDPDDNDVVGHGTHVASIALGRGVPFLVPRGVAPGANLIDIKVSDQNGVTTAATLIRALEVLWSHQAFLGPVHVVYIGFTADVPEDQAVPVAAMLDIVSSWASAPLNNTIIVAAAGDDSNPDSESRLKRLPGGHVGVIAVGASDDLGTENRADDTLWPFTPAGPVPLTPFDAGQYRLTHLHPQLTAPGVNIAAAASNSRTGVRTLTGTSMAAAHVAGAAALFVQAGSVVPLDAMIATAELPAGEPAFAGPFAAGQSPSRPWNQRWGHGKLNAFGALDTFIDRRTDVGFADANGSPVFGNAAFTFPTGHSCGSDEVLRVRVRNFGAFYTAKNVGVRFGSSPGRLTDSPVQTTYHDSINQSFLTDLPPGASAEFEVVVRLPPERRALRSWVARLFTRRDHRYRKCSFDMTATLTTADDLTPWNNVARYRNKFHRSPITVEAANHVSSSSETFTFVATALTPGSQWTMLIEPANVTLAPEDTPEVISLLPIPPAGTPVGAQERFRVQTLWNGEVVGEVFTEAVMTDCNGNGCDDWFDIMGGPLCGVAGSSRDCDEDAIPDECQGLCAADFNRSGAVSVQDIFDYLAAYFRGDPCADFNGSGANTVQDLFDFLAAYFAGCD